MKRLNIYSTDLSDVPEFDVEFVVSVSNDSELDVAASHQIPQSSVIRNVRELSLQEIDDWMSFVVSVEDTLIDTFGLELTYFNDSNDQSMYYNFLAKDENGKVVAKFRLRIRIANHAPHRTKQSQKYKKQELSSPELLKYVDNPKDLRVIYHQFTVNSDVYDSWIDAYNYIVDQVKSIMVTMGHKF